MTDEYNPDLESQIFDGPAADVDDDAGSTEPADDASPADDDATDVADDDSVSGADDAGDDEDEDDEDDDLAEQIEALRSEAAEAQRLRQWAAQKQAEENHRQAQAYWTGQEQQIRGAYAQAWDALQHEVQQGFLNAQEATQRSMELLAGFDQDMGALHQRREAAWAQVAMRQSAPNYAAQIARQYKLTQAETQELLQYAPNDMAREAARIKKARSETDKLRAELDDLKRQLTAQQVAGRTVAPGGGRGVQRQVRAGSREHLRVLMGW